MDEYASKTQAQLRQHLKAGLAQYTTGVGLLGQQNGKSDAARERTVDALSSAVSRLRGAFGELNDLANELCGCPPLEQTGQAIRGEPSGMFEAVSYAANDIDSITTEIAMEIKRIRSRM